MNATFPRAVLASAAALAAALVLAWVALAGAQRSAAIAGVLTAGVTGALALFLMRRTLHRSIKTLLAAILASFVARIILVAVGMILSIRLGSPDTAMPYAISFFGLFFVLQSIEFAYAQGAAKTGEKRT